jgi:hypothetical protein
MSELVARGEPWVGCPPVRRRRLRLVAAHCLQYEKYEKLGLVKMLRSATSR